MRLNTSTENPLSFMPLLLPTRSRLYNMEPVGLRTGQVESLISYVARLAEAHTITLATLFGWEIAPLIDRKHIRRTISRSNKNAALAASFRPMARAVNGTGITANDFVAALQKLTLREDLHCLTMLTWRHIISHRHLTRAWRAWCPSCYEEWHIRGEILYEPLLWSLEAVNACTRHQRCLRSQCQSCRKTLYLLTSRFRPGYCSVCDGWLGESLDKIPPAEEQIRSEDLGSQEWTIEQIGSLLAAASDTEAPPKTVISESISHCIEGARNEFAFARQLKLPQTSLNEWKRGESVPQLDKLLKVCLYAEVSLLDFVLGEMPERSKNNNREERPEDCSRAKGPRHFRRWTELEVDTTRIALELLVQTTPPLPMIEIARRVGRAAGSLYGKFPAQCREAVIRYEEYQKECRREFWERVGRNLEDAIEKKSPPSVEEVARNLGCSRTVLADHFPDLCTCLSKLYLGRRETRRSTIESALKEALNQNPPQHLRNLAKRLKCSHTSIRSYFPEHCHQLAIRYSRYRNECSEQKRERLRREIRRVALKLFDEGIYPSVKKVSEYFSSPQYLRSNKTALAVLRELRLELYQRVVPTQ